jgi:hypothetical protein
VEEKFKGDPAISRLLTELKLKLFEWGLNATTWRELVLSSAKNCV